MSNRKGGHYDSDGNWWAPYTECSRWRKILDGVIVYALLTLILAGIGTFGYYAMSYRSADDYRDGIDGPDRGDMFHNR